MKSACAILLVLWVLFGAFGIALHRHATAFYEARPAPVASIAGLDGEVYLKRYCSIFSMFRMRKRHPAADLVTAPAFLVGAMVEPKAGPEAAKIANILLFAAVGAATVALIRLLTGDTASTALFLSFAYTWLLSGSPELFAVSQLILVATLLLVKRQVDDIRVWAGMTLLACGTTITNAVKPVAAFLVLLPRNPGLLLALRRQARKILIGLLVLAAAAAAVETAKWFLIDRMSLADEFRMGWEYVVKWFSGGFGFGERLARTWEMFFCEPLMTHGAIFGQANEDGLDILPLGYRNALPHAVCAALFALCTWSAWRNRRDTVVQAALAMFAFDFLLHVALGWGLCEAQIYCGHWMFIVPILIAGVQGKWWKYAFAAVIFAWNLQCVLS